MSILKDLGDGILTAQNAIEVPFSGSRLQGFFGISGACDIALWGAGPLASVRAPFLDEENSARDTQTFTASPNALRIESEERMFLWSALIDAPILVLRWQEKESLKRFSSPSVRFTFSTRMLLRETSHKSAQFDTDLGEYRYFKNGSYAAMVIERAWGDDSESSHNAMRGIIIIALGFEEEVAAQRARIRSLIQEACDSQEYSYSLDTYLQELRTKASVISPEYRTEFIHCLHAARASLKRDHRGSFAGLSAGIGYSLPARTYFRDGYWTCLALLPWYPEFVKLEIELLSEGIGDDGSCPSGVIYANRAGLAYWKALKAQRPDIARDHQGERDWWSDHFDSPLFFINLVFDYIDRTSDNSILEHRTKEGEGPTIRQHISTILARYEKFEDENGFPLKPYHDRDWADNVFRSGIVTYDISLYYGALIKAASIDTSSQSKANRLKLNARRVLELETHKYPPEFIQPDGYREDHLTIETVSALHFGLIDGLDAENLLESIKAYLFTAHNRSQPYGTWGIMSVYPLYKKSTRRREKSCFPYRYHNGADWPYWDGLLAWVFSRSKDPAFEYAATAWWRYCMAQGWPSAVEYFSPPYGCGSKLQAWSSLVVRAFLEASTN